MSDNVAEWLVTTGRGDRPTLRWSFSVDAPLTDLRLSRETGEVVAADVSGALYVLDRLGRVQALTRTRHSVKRLAWSDTGGVGAVVLDHHFVSCFDRHLQFQWTREMPDEVLSVAVDPYGTHMLMGLTSGLNVVLTKENKKCSRFETERPVRYAQFLTHATELIVASEYGFLGRYTLSGVPVWTTKLWSTVGDLAATGDGRAVFLAGYALGIQAFDGQTGNTRGTFVCEGTVGQVSCGFTKRSLIAYTMERTLFGVDDDGTSQWNVTPDEDILRIIQSPLGDYMICGFASGRIMRFDFVT